MNENEQEKFLIYLQQSIGEMSKENSMIMDNFIFGGM